MLKIRLPPDVRNAIAAACRRAGTRETGGMLFGEHLGPNDFRIVEATVEGMGTLAGFLRRVGAALVRLESFFRRTHRDYRRFNYLGEWHSHPSFALHPSTIDDATMFDIVNDPETEARFAVSLIVKLNENQLAGAAFAYYPPNEREATELSFEA